MTKNTFILSAFILLLFNPYYIQSVGFQLSYMAVIGIVIIQPWINDWFSIKYWLPRKVWEITAVSIAAQIATFPDITHCWFGVSVSCRSDRGRLYPELRRLCPNLRLWRNRPQFRKTTDRTKRPYFLPISG